MNVPGYELKKVIATGGMATVYLAIQKSLGRKVALKILNEIDNDDRSERFLSEGKIIAHLNHRNIITIHDIGKVDSRHYIAMEYLEGGTLAEQISRGIRIEQVTEVMESISNALAYVHGHKIIHRDIKPTNILFHEDGTAKLTDFGIAKLAGDESENGSSGRIIGSPYYLSPEQVEGKSLDQRSDLYGLGIVLYEMLTGEKPFSEDTPVKTMVARLKNPVPVLPEKLYRYQPLVEKLVNRKPENRIGSAKEVSGIVKRLKNRKHQYRRKPAFFSRIFLPVHKAVPEKIRSFSYATAIFALTVTGVLLNSFNAQSNLGISILELSDSFITSTQSEPDDIGSATIGRDVDGAGINSVNVDTDSNQVQLAGAYQASYSPGYSGGDQLEPLPSRQQTSRLVLIPSDQDQIDSISTAGIDQFLAEARRAMDDYRLTRPQGDNAYYYFSRVEIIDPENREAEEGYRTIADTYALLAQHEINKGNFGDALIFMGRGLTVMPDHELLISLKADLSDRGFSDYTATMGSDDLLRLTSMNGGLPVTDVSLASVGLDQNHWSSIWQALSDSSNGYALDSNPGTRAK